MRTIELAFAVPHDWRELLIAELADLDFDAFEDTDDHLKAYVPASRWTDVKRQTIQQWLHQRDLPVAFGETEHAPKDWNETWEQTIQPLAVGSFLIRPTWHETPAAHAGQTLLVIDPKMSFGTGYHESTRLMLRLLPNHVADGDRVLDAGTGTGVLGIAALKCGAAHALTFDTDEWAADNAAENFYLNHVADRAEFREGSLDVVTEDGFDVIFANINRNVLLDLLPGFAAKLTPDGTLLLAGLLKTDRPLMLEALADAGLAAVEEAEENEWWAVVSRKA